MAAIEDHGYVKLCAELANCLSISIASARRRVELAAAREGIRDLNSRKKIARSLLDKARLQLEKGEGNAQLDHLLAALAEEENFMIED